MSDTSFDERDRSLGYGRRTYHAACAPGVEITDEQLHAMQRLAVALGLVPNGGKRARPEKLCALLAQHYASAPGLQLAELPRDLRSLIVAMLDDRSARRLALTSVLGAVDASTSLERRRAPYDRLRELLPPLVFWLAASHALHGWLNGDYMLSPFGRAWNMRERIVIGGKELTYAEWRTYLDKAERVKPRLDLARDLVGPHWNLRGYCDSWKYNLPDELRHPLLMVAMTHALLKAGELMIVESRLGEVRVALKAIASDKNVPVIGIDENMLKQAREDRTVAIETTARLLAAGKATLHDLVDINMIMDNWRIKDPTRHAKFSIERVHLRPTIDLWQAVIASVLSGPAAGELIGLARQLDTA